MHKKVGKAGSSQGSHPDDLYHQLIGDIERARYENKNPAKRMGFYKALLQNIPALFIIINLSRRHIIWKNDEFKYLASTTDMHEEGLVEQVGSYYGNTGPAVQREGGNTAGAGITTGIFKLNNPEGESISYYFKGYTLEYGGNNAPEEVLLTAFNLNEKINTDYRLEQLTRENKRLKNRLAISLLTKREKEIVKLISRGNSSRAIAEELDLSFYTVETHRKNILRKVELHNTAELIRFATEAGLV